jgi:hypothetical protein
MKLSKQEIIDKLPRNRDFWFAGDLAEAIGVTKRTIQRTAKRFNVGRKVRHGPAGTYVFQWHDLDALLNNMHGEVGNPVNIAIHRERIKKCPH